MNTHEYQAKLILKKFGISTPEFAVASNMDEVSEIVKMFDLNEAVLKVQVHAGGRGKAGGVKFARDRDEIYSHAQKLIGMKIINNQTGPQGVVANQILITRPVNIKKEYYLGAVIDRQRAAAVLIASPEGGVDIEEVADKFPGKILRLPIPLDGKFRHYQLLRVAKFMGWSGDLVDQGERLVSGLAKAFIETDASLLEINPLVLTEEGDLVVLDAKLSIDDNAMFRHPEFKEMYDPTQHPEHEARAAEHELAYVALNGDIGCMVNGAGLAMATMDIIKHYGGAPANFLDVGGGASEEKVAEGFKIILSDPQVKAVLVNIFGGIMNCGTLATGIVSAAKELKVHVPLIVRMEGTNVEQGKKILADSGLNIITADHLSEAAEKVVKASRQV